MATDCDVARPTYLTSSTDAPRRRIAIAVDLSNESAYAVRWAVANYLRPVGDFVVLLHVRPTSVLFGADWGSLSPSYLSVDENNGESDDKSREKDFDAFTAAQAQRLAQPMDDAGIPYKIHIVKDHDMKERICLEAERLGISAMIMGSRGFGAAVRGHTKGRLGSVSDYCVHHCFCPVVVVRYPSSGDVVTDNGAIVESSAGYAKETEETMTLEVDEGAGSRTVVDHKETES